jgi:type IV pilus assembly protein PilO
LLQGKRAPLIVGAAFIVVIVLMVFFLVFPKMGQVTESQDTLAEAQAEQGTLQSELNALAEAEAAAPEAEATIREADQLVPPTANPEGFLLLIKNAATQSGITLNTITPGVPVPDPETGLSTISVTLDATGSYFSLTEYLYRLETLPRAAKVESIQMAPGAAAAATDTTVTTVSTGILSMQANVVLFTTDASAGPGSDPAATTADEAAATTPTATVPDTGEAP